MVSSTSQVYDFFRNLILGMSIVILLPLTISYGIRTFVPKPATQTCGWNNRSSECVTWAKNYTSIALVIGLLSIVAGALLSVDFISGGFIFGGVITMVTAFTESWTVYSNIFKFGILVSAIVLLTFLGFIFYRREQK